MASGGHSVHLVTVKISQDEAIGFQLVLERSQGLLLPRLPAHACGVANQCVQLDTISSVSCKLSCSRWTDQTSQQLSLLRWNMRSITGSASMNMSKILLLVSIDPIEMSPKQVYIIHSICWGCVDRCKLDQLGPTKFHNNLKPEHNCKTCASLHMQMK